MQGIHGTAGQGARSAPVGSPVPGGKMGEMIILPGGRRRPLEAGRTILSHLQEAGAPVTAHCGGRGECRACAIRIDRPDLLSPKTGVEESLLADPLMRLACQSTIVRAEGILRVELPRYPRVLNRR